MKCTNSEWFYRVTNESRNLKYEGVCVAREVEFNNNNSNRYSTISWNDFLLIFVVRAGCFFLSLLNIKGRRLFVDWRFSLACLSIRNHVTNLSTNWALDKSDDVDEKTWKSIFHGMMKMKQSIQYRQLCIIVINHSSAQNVKIGEHTFPWTSKINADQLPCSVQSKKKPTAIVHSVFYCDANV